jgi:hypothetical protein
MGQSKIIKISPKSIQIWISNLRRAKTSRNDKLVGNTGDQFTSTKIDKPIFHISLLNIFSDRVLTHVM